VRKLCPKCKTTRIATVEEEKILQKEGHVPSHAFDGLAEAQSKFDMPLTIADAKGCDHCHHTGYRGRLAVTEILRITPEMDELIAANAPRSAMRKLAANEGFRTMASDGIAKVLRHETSLPELRRAVDMTRLS
jgi:general secretion pathway protein E/type IV pilus assembly protein PilB